MPKFKKGDTIFAKGKIISYLKNQGIYHVSFPEGAMYLTEETLQDLPNENNSKSEKKKNESN